MGNAHSEKFKIFINIPPAQIAADQEEIKGNAVAFDGEIDLLEIVPFDQRTPAQEARLWHLRLLRAWLINEMEGIPLELKVFQYSKPASRRRRRHQMPKWRPAIVRPPRSV